MLPTGRLVITGRVVITLGPGMTVRVQPEFVLV